MSCKDLIVQVQEENDKILVSKQVTDAIQAPLLQLIEQVKTLGKPSTIKGLNLAEFYYYHATRILRLVFSKALERFTQAKVKMENPKVAEDFKALIPHIIDLCKTVETLSQPKGDEDLNMRLLENLTDELYEKALDRDFMYSPDEEMKLENISEEKLKDFVSLVQ